MLKLRELIGGTKTNRYCPATVRDASLKCHGLSKWVLLRLEIKQNHWSIIKKKVVICYQLRPDVQTYRHPPRYWCQCSRNSHVHSKMPSCCPFSDSHQNELV